MAVFDDERAVERIYRAIAATRFSSTPQVQ
jgi:hypothetical protein